MTGLSYVADAAGVFSSVAAVRWTRGRLNIPSKRLVRALVAAAGMLVGCLSYFLIGFALSLMQPAHQADLLSELAQGIGFGTKIIMAATIVATFYYHGSRKKLDPMVPPDAQVSDPAVPPEAGVRERLERARADIERRIESLQASPVHDYRGGIPQPDLIIEDLREKLSEIDDALSQLGPANEADAEIDEHAAPKHERQ